MIISKQLSQNKYLRVVVQAIIKMTNFSKEIISKWPFHYSKATIPKQYKANSFNHNTQAYDY